MQKQGQTYHKGHLDLWGHKIGQTDKKDHRDLWGHKVGHGNP